MRGCVTNPEGDVGRQRRQRELLRKLCAKS